VFHIGIFKIILIKKKGKFVTLHQIVFFFFLKQFYVADLAIINIVYTNVCMN